MKNFCIRPKEIFHTTQTNNSLGSLAVRESFYSVVLRGIQIFTKFIGLMILARILIPEDFGLIAMVSIFINFAALFKDFGLSSATIQKQQITESQVSYLFWVNIVITVVISFCIIMIAPLVSIFYNRPELSAITTVLAINFLIQGVGVQHNALLRRGLRFFTVGVIEVIGVLIGVISAVIFAKYDLGYWSLVWSSILSSILVLLLTFLFVPWIPGLAKKDKGVVDMLHFGINVTGVNLALFFSQNMDRLLIGKIIGAEGLAFYTRAFSIVQMPVDGVRKPLSNVALSTLSKLQNDTIRLKRYAKKYTFLLAFFSMPSMVFAFNNAHEIIILILGKNWIGIESLFQIFVIVGFIQLPFTVVNLLLVAIGKTKQYLKLGVFTSISFVLMFAIGIIWDLHGVAVGYAACTYLIIIPTLIFTKKHTSFDVKDFLSALLFPSIFSLITGVITFLLSPILSSQSNFKLVLDGLLFLLIYIAFFYAIPYSRHLFKNDVLGTFKSFKQMG